MPRKHARRTPRTPLAHAIILSAGLLACTLPAHALPAHVQPAGPPAPASSRALPPEQTLPIPDIRARLESLSPDRAIDYFLLGEEVAQEVSNPAESELARTLYVLAFDLDRKQGGRLSASIALALADLVGIGSDRDWLIALAHALDHRLTRQDWRRSAPPEASGELAYRAALAVGRVRSGHGNEAQELLSDPDVFAIIKRYEPLLSPVGQPGRADWLLREARRWPCPECGFDRLSKAEGPSETGFVPCRVCQGSPGPQLSLDEFLATLRFEARMLSGAHRSWAAQVIADAGSPVRDPDPGELAGVLAVDPRKTLWRDGRWIAPEGDQPPPEADQPATPAKKPDAEGQIGQDQGT